MTPSDADYLRAVDLLVAGELVAIPTETVYGLGADAANPAAVAKIFAAKGRPADHPLIVHLAGHDAVDHWAEQVPDVAWELMETFWPGPLTLILKKQAWVPDAVTGGQDTVGLRVPGHPVALELLRRFARAKGEHAGIAAPSANRFGRISPTDAEHVREELGTAVALVLDGGPCQVGIESTIVDLSRDDAVPRILRPGHITPERIAAVIGITPDFPSGRPAGAVPRVSGSLDAHYAPRTALRVVASADLAGVLPVLTAQGNRVGLLARTDAGAIVPVSGLCRLPDDPEGYARGFYAALRELDQGGNDLIVVEALGAGSEWAAVADRLRRAACGAGEG